jgi:phosphonate transport system substrate-binding protein
MLRLTAVALLAVSCAAMRSAPKAAEEKHSALSFGILHQTGEKAAANTAALLNAYLVKSLDLSVTVPVFETPAQLAEALAGAKIDAAWMNPGSYVHATKWGEVEPILKLSRGGFGRYRSVFFARTSSGLKSLKDLKGKTFAWLRPGSMSGRLFPSAQLKKKGIDPASYFSRLVEAKDHAEVCQLVFEGKVDAGVTLGDYRAPDELVPDSCVQNGMDADAFAVLDSVGPIPNDVIAVRGNMSPGLRDRLKDALMEMRRSEAGRAQMHEIFKADGFVPAADTDFAVVRELEQYLGD